MHARFEGVQNDGRENRDWAEEERETHDSGSHGR